MAAMSDSMSVAGYMPNGTRPDTVDQNGDSWDQNNCTSRVLVNLDEGVERVATANQIDDPSRIIGGRTALQNFDSRLNLLKGDIALVDLDKVHNEFDGGGAAFDGRPHVISALVGYIVPHHHTTESSFKRSKRAVGFISQDSILENAKTGQAARYGNAVYNSGALGGNNLYHAVSGKIAAGTLMQVDIGPMNNEDRAKWREGLIRSKDRWDADAHKPVLRPWNPNGGAQALIDGFEQYLADSSTRLPGALNVLANPAQVGADARMQDPDSQTGASLAKATHGAMWMGIMLAMRAGLVQPAANPANVNKLEDLFAFTQAETTFAADLARRLGLAGSNSDSKLCAGMMGAFWQPYTDDQGIADMFPIHKALADESTGRSIADTSSARLVRTVTGAYYENQNNILFKTTANTLQGMKLRGVVVH